MEINEELIKEAREDIKEMRKYLANIDTNLAVALNRLSILERETQTLVVRTERHEKNINFYNATFTIIGIVGGLIIFLANILPLIDRLFK